MFGATTRMPTPEPSVEIICSGTEIQYEGNKNVYVSFLSTKAAPAANATDDSYHCRLYFSMPQRDIEVEKIAIRFRLGELSRSYNLADFKCDASESYATFDLIFFKKDLAEKKAPPDSRKLLFVNCRGTEYPLAKGSVVEKIYIDRIGTENVTNYNITDCKKYLQNSFGKKALCIFDSFSCDRNRTDFFLICFLLKEGGLYINLKGTPDSVRDFRFRKKNGLCYKPDTGCSFLALQFEKGHLFLQYLFDKTCDFYDEMPTIRKTVWEYNDFIEKQLNVCHITLFEIENVDPAQLQEPITRETSGVGTRYLFNEKVYETGDAIIYLQENTDGGDTIDRALTKAIHLKRNKYIFLYVIWPETDSVKAVSFKVTMDYCDSGLMFIRRSQNAKVNHVWLQLSNNPMDHPNLQTVEYTDVYNMMFDIANFFTTKNMFREAYNFFKTIDHSRWLEMCRKTTASWDTIDQFSSCCEEIQKKEKCIYTLLMMYESCKSWEGFEEGKNVLTVLKYIVSLCRRWNLFRQSKLYRTEAISILDRLEELCRSEHEGEFLKRMRKGLCNEHIIYSAYLGIRDIMPEYMYVACNHEHTYEYVNCIYNLKYYKPVVQVAKTINISERICMYDSEFRSSSTSIQMLSDQQLIMNKRFVNYKIEPNGAYIVPKFLKPVEQDGVMKSLETPRIITVNKAIVTDYDFDSISEKIFDTEFHNNRLLGLADICEGIEDIKLFKYNQRIYFLGTMCGVDDLHMVYGHYDYLNSNTLQVCRITSDTFPIARVEKNWCFVEISGLPHFIYSWYPFKLLQLDMENHTVKLVRESQVSKFFSMARGSTNTTFFDEKHKICVIHYVDYNNGNKRHYYHSFVLLDNDANIVRHSSPFTFQQNDIEYCVGIVCRDNEIVCVYSKNDSESFIAIVPRQKILDMLQYTME